MKNLWNDSESIKYIKYYKKYNVSKDLALRIYLRYLLGGEKKLVLLGGGNIEENVSVNLIKAVNYAKDVNSKILGIVGRDGGYTKIHGDQVILIPTVEEHLVTPLSESFQSIIWHSIVSNPKLQINKTKW